MNAQSENELLEIFKRNWAQNDACFWLASPKRDPIGQTCAKSSSY